MWENIVEPGRPNFKIRRMRIACWIPKTTNTHSEYVIILPFPLQEWLYERASILRAQLVLFPLYSKQNIIQRQFMEL